MLRAIAVETSGRIGSVAVVQEGRVLVEEQFEHGLKHAAQVIPMLDGLVRGQGWSPKDLEELYVSAGPGSFTGLRIGITLAKTLALATGVGIVAVPTLRVLAENAPPEARHLLLVLDAKREQIYTARYERAGDQWLEREPPHLDTLAAMLERAPRPVHLLGEGLPQHEKHLPPGDSSIISLPPDFWRAQASQVARVGYALARKGCFVDPDRLVPLYIRRPEAEEKYQERTAPSADTSRP